MLCRVPEIQVLLVLCLLVGFYWGRLQLEPFCSEPRGFPFFILYMREVWSGARSSLCKDKALPCGRQRALRHTNKLLRTRPGAAEMAAGAGAVLLCAARPLPPSAAAPLLARSCGARRFLPRVCRVQHPLCEGTSGWA